MSNEQNSIFYFETKEDRNKAYEILRNHNFYFPFGESTSITDVDNADYMLELLSSDGFDISKILVKKQRKTQITESTIYDQIFNVLQKASLSEMGSCEGYSIELGELALQVFEKLSDSQKVAFKGEYSYEDAYTRQTIDIDSDKVYLEWIDFEKEFETKTSLTQHDMWSDDEEENKEIITYDDMEDLTGKEKLDMMYECDLKPYLRDKTSIDIFKRQCFVQFTHYHQYVNLIVIFDKTNFNYSMYEDVKVIVSKILTAYYDKLLELNGPKQTEKDIIDMMKREWVKEYGNLALLMISRRITKLDVMLDEHGECNCDLCTKRKEEVEQLQQVRRKLDL